MSGAGHEQLLLPGCRIELVPGLDGWVARFYGFTAETYSASTQKPDATTATVNGETERVPSLSHLLEPLKSEYPGIRVFCRGQRGSDQVGEGSGRIYEAEYWPPSADLTIVTITRRPTQWQRGKAI